MTLLAPATLVAQVGEHRLPNGLELLVVQGGDPRDVEVTAGYFVGLLDDSLRGIAHFMEHVAMRETRDGRSLAARYRELAVDGGASTSNDITVFAIHGRGGADLLDSLLMLQRRRMTDLAVASQAIETERRSIHTEMDGRAQDPWVNDVFGSPRLRRGNSHADLDRITRESLIAFYDRYYRPSNAAIVVVSALPESTVVAHTVAIFGAVPATAPAMRPIFRDSTRIVVQSWRGTRDGQRLLVSTVPGPQDPLRPLLDLAFARVQRVLSQNVPRVDGRLDAEVPVSVVVLSTRDSADADRRLDEAWDRLRDEIRTARPGVVSAHLGSAELLGCEAAGNWRYCLADSVRIGNAASSLATLLGSRTRDSVAVLWPRPLRSPPAAAVVAATSPGRGRTWHPPANEPIGWQRAAGGMEWTAREGGVDDSVFIGMIVAPSSGTPTPARVAALEMWVRCWKDLRLPSGVAADSLLRARGVTIAIRPLPYPPLATADAFFMVGAAPTPLGVFGVEVLLSAPRDHAADALAILHQAFDKGTVDSSVFAALETRQLELLRANVAGPRSGADVVKRQKLAQTDGANVFRFAPESPDAQLATMTGMTLGTVNGAGSSLMANGIARITILGAPEAAAREWIASSGFARLGMLRWPVAAMCAPAPVDTATIDIHVGPPRPQTTLYAFSCFDGLSDGHAVAAATVANAVLGGGEDALLAHRLRAELGAAYSFSSRVVRIWDSPLGIWTLEINTPSAGVDSTIREIRAVLANAVERGPSATLFARARDIVVNARRPESSDGIPWVRGVVWDGRSPEQNADLAASVTFDEAMAMLRRFANPRVVRIIHTR